MVGIHLIVVTVLILFFSIAQGTLPWQPILGLKRAKSADSPSFVALVFLNGVKYRNSDFNMFICDDLATSCKNLVYFGPVTPGLKKGKDVTCRRSTVWLHLAVINS